MASKIGWTDETVNGVIGCSLESPGCTHCYAMRDANRLGQNPRLVGKYQGLTEYVKGRPVWNGTVRFWPEALLKPFEWTKPRMIFYSSMGDLFHPDVQDEWIDRHLAVAALLERHTYQLCTKRSARMESYFNNPHTPARVMRWVKHYWDEQPEASRAPIVNGLGLVDMAWPLRNVWLLVSVEDQERTSRLDDLVKIPAVVRGVSAEPLLEELDLRPWLGKLDWVITGGESGKGARRPSFLGFLQLRKQCRKTGVAFFFKQWGYWISDVWLDPPYLPKIVDYRPRFSGETNDLLLGRRYHNYPTPRAL